MENLFKGTVVMNLLEKASEIQHSKVWRTVFTDEEFETMILDLIRIKQLFEEGIDETGQVIGYYSWTTENIYNSLKKAGTPYTLKDTGEFYKSMDILVEDDSFIIDADPMKTDKTGNETNLFEKFGEGIIGLTDDNKQVLIEEIKERFYYEVKRLLQ
jgi:hypothetical protein